MSLFSTSEGHFEHVYPFMLNGLSLSTGRIFSNFRVFGILNLYSNLNTLLCKQTVKIMIKCSILLSLIWVCTFCIMSHKTDLMLILVDKVLRYCPKQQTDGLLKSDILADSFTFINNSREFSLEKKMCKKRNHVSLM